MDIDVDRSSNKTTSGAAQVGIVPTSLDGLEVEYALHFNFKATKYETEYETLLVGLSIAAIFRVDGVIVRCDSQLRQVSSNYIANE